MKRLIKHSIRQVWVALLLLLATGGCTDDTFVEDNRPVVDENGMVTLRFDANIPGLKLTRSVDINGEAISTLWIVAFNENKKMISRVLATISVDVNTGNSGTFTAKVPSSTRILHFLANVNMDNFNDQENMGRDENEVIAPMVSSSGNLVYWGRKAFTDVPNLAGETITLYRNQALVEYQVAESTGIQVLGWAAMNQYAYGTVAPFDASDTDNAFHFSLTTGTEADDFVTTLPEAYNVKQTDVESVAQASSQEGDPRYLFETPNPENDQVYLIMLIQKGSGKAKYYKILLVDEEKTPYPIIRNHKYIVDIQNVNEAYGVENFEAAKTATPANNPWITIRDEVPEVVNGETTLRIEGKTTVLYQKEGDYEIAFYYNGSTRPTVEFISNEGVGEVTDVEWTKPNGTIHLHINAPAKGQIMEGTLQVKEGVLSRRVKIFVAEPFEFTPIWVGSEIPLLDGENIAVLFHIPDNFPEELLPVDVKFGCDLIDAQTNQPLKVITEETSYTVPNGPNSTHVVTKDWNYKYVYTADHIGQHRVDFRTILTRIGDIGDTDAQNAEFHIYMEGDDPDTGQDMFKHRDLFFAFQPESATNYRNRRRILLEGGDSITRFTTREINTLNPIYGETIKIPFQLATLEGDADLTSIRWSNIQTPYLNGNETAVSADNDCEIWVYYDPTLVKPTWTTETAQKDNYGNTYSVYTATAQSNTINFTTISPNFDCYIVLSAKSTSYNTFDNDMGVNPAGWGFRSASVTVHSTGRLNFNPAFSTDGNNFTPINDGEEFAIPYGTEQNVYVRIDIEEAARGKAFQFRVKTSNLNPIAASGQEGQWTQEGDEWVYTFKEGETTGVNEKVFHFQTSRLASGETITLSSGNYVGYNPIEVRIKNKDLTGTIQLPEGVTFQISNPYIILERKRDGTRIGTFAITGDPKGKGEANYTLTLRGEYNLNAWDEVTIKWEPVSGEHTGTVYSYSCQLQGIMTEDAKITLSANS